LYSYVASFENVEDLPDFATLEGSLVFVKDGVGLQFPFADGGDCLTHPNGTAFVTDVAALASIGAAAAVCVTTTLVLSYSCGWHAALHACHRCAAAACVPFAADGSPPFGLGAAHWTDVRQLRVLQFTGEIFVPERGLYIQTVGEQPLQYSIHVDGMLISATNTLNPLDMDPGWYSIR
jgi:hypothetical protein